MCLRALPETEKVPKNAKIKYKNQKKGKHSLKPRNVLIIIKTYQQIIK